MIRGSPVKHIIQFLILKRLFPLSRLAMTIGNHGILLLARRHNLHYFFTIFPTCNSELVNVYVY